VTLYIHGRQTNISPAGTFVSGYHRRRNDTALCPTGAATLGTSGRNVLFKNLGNLLKHADVQSQSADQLFYDSIVSEAP